MLKQPQSPFTRRRRPTPADMNEIRWYAWLFHVHRTDPAFEERFVQLMDRHPSLARVAVLELGEAVVQGIRERVLAKLKEAAHG